MSTGSHSWLLSPSALSSSTRRRSRQEPSIDAARLTVGLDSLVEAVPNVGPTGAARLAKLGIATVRDLLLHLPFGWDEYGEPTPVAKLSDGKQATVIGTITSISAKRTKYKKMQLTEATLEDD